MNDVNVNLISENCKAKLNLAIRELPNDFYYGSLPLCVIDAIYSINARYTSTQNTVRRFAQYVCIERYSRKRLPAAEQMLIEALVSMYKQHTPQEMAEEVFINRQRTSPRGGILKAEAVKEFAEALLRFKVNYLQDAESIFGCKEFERETAKIPGQSSLISTDYFCMLAGSEDHIKSDRMMGKFIWSAIQQKLNREETQQAITEACQILVKEYPRLTPRILDYLIWSYQSQL